MTVDWISLHAFHGGSADPLLTEAVAPLTAELRSQGLMRDFFFLRYWEGGPHLRLRLRPSTPPAAEVLRRLAHDRLAGALEGRLLPSMPDARAYRELAGRLAAAEGLADYDRRLRLHPGVEHIPYRPEERAFGGREAVRAAERHFTVSSDIALGLLVRGAGQPRRAGFAFAALVLALAAWEPDPARVAGLISASSTAWGTAAPMGRDPGTPADHPRQHAGLRAHVDRYWRLGTGAVPQQPDDAMTAWLRSIRRLRDELTDLQRRGRFAPQGAGSALVTPDAGATAAEYALLVTLLRCVHLLHNRLGLGPSRERSLLLFARTALIEFTTGKETR
ncbi:lantibiotic dehydratase C-terminal domain-containing protein [Streptomyces sp. NPDC000405]|uniref:lantibiotic dehydratase C-terminal domain-containing protein n=1 Tax=Streptomyces sp. NPDC000405 TaxID=3161033 RepID=UPI00398CB306